MAVQLCLDTPGWAAGMSPRISFSHDLFQSDGSIPIDRRSFEPSLLDSDFDFCISSDQESSTADELFSGGKILPFQFKTSLPTSPKPPSSAPPPPQLPLKSPQKESLREIMAVSSTTEERPISPKSFWRFTRSSSLNCGNSQKASFTCSLPPLSRSNSTGSINSNARQSPTLSKENCYKPVRKFLPNPNQRSYFSSSPTSFQKPPLKKTNSGGKTQFRSYGNGVRISPVLNIPPYIPKGTTTGPFCFGYFFCNRKDAKTKKKSPSSPLSV